MENISAFWKTKDVEDIPDEQYLKCYKLLKKLRTEMLITKKYIMKKNRITHQKFKVTVPLTPSEQLEEILKENNYFEI